MKNSLELRPILAQLKPGFLQSMHWVAHKVFQARGYRWELRRNGDLKLGLWRKSFLKAGAKKAEPKRLILIPGFGDTPLSWLIVTGFLMPVIRARYDEIILVDFPGYTGFLSRERSFHSIDLLLNAQRHVFDSLKPHTIIGHSLGGYLAAFYASQCGERKRNFPDQKFSYTGPEKLILVNPYGVFESDRTRLEFEGKIRGLLEKGFDFWRPFVFAKEPLWFRLAKSEFTRFIAREEIPLFLASFSEAHAIENRLADVQAETWLVWGEKDSLHPASSSAAWVKGLTSARQAQAVLLKRIGHSPQIESASVTAAVMGQILADRKPSRAGARWWRVGVNA